MMESIVCAAAEDDTACDGSEDSGPLLSVSDIHTAYLAMDPVIFTVAARSPDGRCPESLATSTTSAFCDRYSISFQLYESCGARSVDGAEKLGLPLTPRIVYRTSVTPHPILPAGMDLGSRRLVAVAVEEPVQLPIRLADVPVTGRIVCRVRRRPCVTVTANNNNSIKHRTTEYVVRNALPSSLCIEEDEEEEENEEGWWRAVIPIFDSDGTGHRLIVGPRRYPLEAAAACGLTPPPMEEQKRKGRASTSQERAETRLRERYEGCMPPIPWLDAWTERHIQRRRAGAPSTTLTISEPPEDDMCKAAVSEAPMESVWVFHPVAAPRAVVRHFDERTRQRYAYAAIRGSGTTSRSRVTAEEEASMAEQSLRQQWYEAWEAAHRHNSSLSSPAKWSQEGEDSIWDGGLYADMVGSIATYPDYGLPAPVMTTAASLVLLRDAARRREARKKGAVPTSKTDNYSDIHVEEPTYFDEDGGAMAVSGWTEDNVYEKQAALLSASLYMLRSEARDQPGPRERQRLEELAALPPIPLLSSAASYASVGGVTGGLADDVALLWRYRYFIAQKSKYFIPFLRSVPWPSTTSASTTAASAAQVSAAYRMMKAWTSLPLAEVLACLSPSFSGIAAMRLLGVHHLAHHLRDDTALERYALPLVHAVRYDSPNYELAQFLLQRVLSGAQNDDGDGEGLLSSLSLSRQIGASWRLCCVLYWSIKVESELEEEVEEEEKRKRGGRGGGVVESSFSSPSALLPLVYLRRQLQVQLETHTPPVALRLRQQEALVQFMRQLASRLAAHGGDRTQRTARGRKKLIDKAYGLRELLAPPSASPTTPLTLPTHPERVIIGVKPDEFYIFKSAKQPFRLVFVVDSDGMHQQPAVTHPHPAVSLSSLAVMFKSNDDIRQDELVLSLLSLMDHLLRQEGLDLCLTPYRVQPTSVTDGMLEMVPHVVTLESIRRDIHGYWRAHHPTPARFDAALQRYIKSLAGYCVITFILGVGDRHLENILMAADGRLLHIDFGYIFGNDPKPFSPPIRLCREMIAALGGPQSAGLHRFQTYCCSAYNVLRRHAALLLYVLSAFSGAKQLPQVSAQGGRQGSGVGGVVESLVKVQEKLRLDLTNPQATQFMLNILADSVGSLFAHLWDAIHTAAQATRD